MQSNQHCLLHLYWASSPTEPSHKLNQISTLSIDLRNEYNIYKNRSAPNTVFCRFYYVLKLTRRISIRFSTAYIKPVLPMWSAALILAPLEKSICEKIRFCQNTSYSLPQGLHGTGGRHEGYHISSNTSILPHELTSETSSKYPSAALINIVFPFWSTDSISSPWSSNTLNHWSCMVQYSQAFYNFHLNEKQSCGTRSVCLAPQPFSTSDHTSITSGYRIAAYKTLNSECSVPKLVLAPLVSSTLTHAIALAQYQKVIKQASSHVEQWSQRWYLLST